MKKLLLAVLVAGAAGAGGCYADAGYGYNGGGGYATAVAPAPNMVYVDGAPGVQVVSDYDYPVFYSDNMYWRYDGGMWYSSRWHDRGWGRSYNVPVGVRGISRPEGYAHYRGGVARGGVYETHQPNAAYRGGGNATYRAAPGRSEPVVRDHRTESAPARKAPVVRDHRH